MSIFRGVVAERLYESQSYAAVDKYDFRDWLAAHGAHEETKWSPYTRAIYDAAFSYNDGRSSEEQISAAVALRTLVRMVLSYRGLCTTRCSGDGRYHLWATVQALRDRGVTFKFFHKASAVHLDEAGMSVARIDFQQQADIKSGDPTSYQPMYDVAGLPCWPSSRSTINSLTQIASRTSTSSLLLGVPRRSHCDDRGRPRLRNGHRRHARADASVPVRRTAALERSLAPDDDRGEGRANAVVPGVMSKDIEQLGWTGPTLPLLSLFVQPYNTWSDMSQTLPRETWPARHAPHSVNYFTGAQPGPDMPAPASDHDFPVRMRAAAREGALCS